MKRSDFHFTFKKTVPTRLFWRIWRMFATGRGIGIINSNNVLLETDILLSYGTIRIQPSLVWPPVKTSTPMQFRMNWWTPHDLRDSCLSVSLFLRAYESFCSEIIAHSFVAFE